jgi:hypothetical protein
VTAVEPMAASVFVQTRGRPRHRDYDFLGDGPGEPWWRAYAGHTAFERPTVLVESDGTGYRAYLSGIPSGRRDSVGTVIRYTVVLRSVGDGPPVVRPAGVLALVGCWLDDQAAGGVGVVSRALDAEFPEAEVERMLATTDPVAPGEVRDRVLAAVAALPPADPADDEETADWWGDCAAPAARAAFTARVSRLLGAGLAGRALLLNLVGSVADLADLDDGRPLAVLAPDVGGAGIAPLQRAGVDAGKAGPSATPPASRTASTPTPAPTIMRVAARLAQLPALVLVLVITTVALVIPLLVLVPLLVLPLFLK